MSDAILLRVNSVAIVAVIAWMSIMSSLLLRNPSGDAPMAVYKFTFPAGTTRYAIPDGSGAKWFTLCCDDTCGVPCSFNGAEIALTATVASATSAQCRFYYRKF